MCNIEINNYKIINKINVKLGRVISMVYKYSECYSNKLFTKIQFAYLNLERDQDFAAPYSFYVFRILEML